MIYNNGLFNYDIDIAVFPSFSLTLIVSNIYSSFQNRSSMYSDFRYQY